MSLYSSAREDTLFGDGVRWVSVCGGEGVSQPVYLELVTDSGMVNVVAQRRHLPDRGGGVLGFLLSR